MALKEEKVSVTSGKKKVRVRKETNAVSSMRVTTVPKNQTTMPPHLPSHPCREVEVCRRKELSKAKSNCEIIKYQIVESPGQSTQVRQRSMKCDTQLLYGASGPIRVKEDGSCRANECTCALQGYVQMCMRSTPCSGETHNRDTRKRVLKTQTWDPSLQHYTSPLHDDSRATTPRQQANLRLTHLQCSHFTWSRNQGV